MKERLDRMWLTTVTTITVFIALLTAGGATFLVANRDDLLQRWQSRDPLGAGLVVAALVIVVGAVGAGVAWLIVRPIRRSVLAPADELVEVAEKFAEGETRLKSVRSGIPEVDRVSEVMVRSAHEMTRSLAAEREFASDASHELRTPLTALLMRLEEISMTDELEVVHEEATIAIGQVERLTRVVDDLLGRGRGGSSAGSAVSLDTVIASLQREWQPAFAQARRSVRVRGERGLFVRSTPVALSQVLSTLLENSLTHGRGTVDVHARRSGPSVVVEVTDQGDGVPAAIAPHIFQRSVSSGRAGSTGRGLALARDLAESNGGRLDLVQAQPARFALFLSEAGEL